jgi:hypothetical protein
MDALLTWAQSNGCLFPRLEAKDFAVYGCGLGATVDIPAGRDVVVVPLKLVICEETATASSLHSALSACNIALDDPYHLIYAFMLHEKAKGPDGLWWPYWNSLPVVVPTPPSMNDEELRVARGTNLFEQVKAIRHQMSLLSKRLAPLIAARPDLLPSATAKELVWCYQIFWSRALSVLWPPGDKHMGCLVPVADLLNHSPVARVSYLTHFEQGVFSIRQEEDIACGAQVFLNYGSRSREKMLLNYGFVDAAPYGTNVLTFNEHAFVVDGDCSVLLAELRRVCEGDETSVVLMMHDLVEKRLSRMSESVEGDSLLAVYAQDQKRLLENVRSVLFNEVLPALWDSKEKSESVNNFTWSCFKNILVIVSLAGRVLF